MSDERVWLEFPATGGKAEFPVQAAAIWRAKGWVDTEPDLTPSIFTDPPEVIAAAEAIEAEKRGDLVDDEAPPPGAADDGGPLVLDPGADASNGAPDVQGELAAEPLPATEPVVEPEKTTTRAGRKAAATTEEG